MMSQRPGYLVAVKGMKLIAFLLTSRTGNHNTITRTK